MTVTMASTSARRPKVHRFLVHTLPAVAWQIVLIGSLFVLYRQGRLLARDEVNRALRNGRGLWDFERTWHVPSETSLQNLVLDEHAVGQRTGTTWAPISRSRSRSSPGSSSGAAASTHESATPSPRPPRSGSRSTSSIRSRPRACSAMPTWSTPARCSGHRPTEGPFGVRRTNSRPSRAWSSSSRRTTTGSTAQPARSSR